MYTNPLSFVEMSVLDMLVLMFNQNYRTNIRMNL
nr:MAG TPA: hypothetical protein [Caudoviricetes sp.]